MKILLACVGKMKEGYFTAAQKEYVKRLSRFSQISVYEATEVKPFGESPAGIQMVIQEEGKRLSVAGHGYDYRVALSPEGDKLDSLKFAGLFNDITVKGSSSICFFIGGSYGLSDEVKKQCDRIISFSDMTFAHQLFRIMLLEQIYRAFKINANETYHK